MNEVIMSQNNLVVTRISNWILCRLLYMEFTILNITDTPRLIWRPTNTEAVEGSDVTVTLECEAVSYPQHTTQWFKVRDL